MESYTQVAADFAQALARGDYQHAWSFIAEGHREALSAQQLQSDYEAMIAYGDGPATFVAVMETLEDWPARQHGDVGWVYVAMAGGGYSEAVAVVVCEAGEQPRIRAIEWGRP